MQLPEVVHRIKKNTVYKPRRRLGFTLIELLIVIFIIGILVSLSTISFTNAQKKGRDGKRKADLKAIQQALEVFYQTNGGYPGYIGNFRGINCRIIGGSNNPMAWGTPFNCNGVTYMPILPKDPLPSGTFYYIAAENGPRYQIYAMLENTSDPDAFPNASFPAACNLIGFLNYCVNNP